MCVCVCVCCVIRYRHSKTNLENMQKASYKHLVTVSFQPAKENFPLPKDTVKDIGATFSDNAEYKGSWRYGLSLTQM